MLSECYSRVLADLIQRRDEIQAAIDYLYKVRGIARGVPSREFMDMIADMPPKRPRDPNQRAKHVVDVATGAATDPDPDAGKNPDAVSLGRRGGQKGGVARARALSPERRTEIAQKAARTRWGTD